MNPDIRSPTSVIAALPSPDAVCFDEILRELQSEIRCIAPEKISVRFDGGEQTDTAPVALAPAAAEDLVRHLVVDAIDSMPDGGTLVLSVEPVSMKRGTRDWPHDLATGEYVLFSFCETHAPESAATETLAVMTPHSLLEKSRILSLSAALEAIQRTGGRLSVTVQETEVTTCLLFPAAN